MKFAISAVFAMLLLGNGIPLGAQENSPAPTLQSLPSGTYTDSRESLQNFLEELLAATRSGNRKGVSDLIKKTEIPHDRKWFSTVFSKDEAKPRTRSYEENLQQNESDLRHFFERIAKDDGQFLTRKVGEEPIPGQGLEWEMLNSNKLPLDAYHASWKSSNWPDARPQFIGFFYFLDGAFRWNSLIHFVPAYSAAAPTTTPDANSQAVSGPVMNVGHDVLPPKMLQSAEAQYTDAARRDHLEGTVILSTIVDIDGRAKQTKVVRSLDAGLDKKALEAVEQWRFSPAMHDGQPVPVRIAIEVRFRLCDKK
jgi:TonB family protein